jgi:hypothetical protein
MSIKKNVQRTVMYKLVDATDFATPETGRAASCVETVSKDGGAFSACANQTSEISHGWYKIVLAASEMNADEIVLKVTDGGTSAQADRLIVTEKSLPDAAADGAGGLPISDTGGLDLDAILADTNELQADDIPGTLATIQADTSELQGDWTNAGRLDAILDLILADTGELQTDDIPGTLATITGYLDTEIAAIVAAVITNAAGTDVAADIIALKAETVAIKAKTDLLPSGIPKNTALAAFEWLMVLAADHISPATGKTVVCQRSIDGAAFANCNTTPATEVSDGVYKVDLAASDLNGDVITLKFTEATCDTTLITIKTDT